MLEDLWGEIKAVQAPTIRDLALTAIEGRGKAAQRTPDPALERSVRRPTH